MKRLLPGSLLFLSLICYVVMGNAFDARSQETTADSDAAPEFVGWPPPDVALVITGHQHGYIEPCGCTGLENQKGGLARRDTFLQQLLAKGWNVVPIDAGNQVRRSGVQAGIKFQSTLTALEKMQYRAVGLGPDDLRLPFGDLLSGIIASTDDQGLSKLFVSCNANPAGFVRSYRVIETGGIRLGVTSALGEQELAKVTQDEIEKRPPLDALRQTVAQMKADRCEFCIVMGQASEEECRSWAKQVRGIDLIVCAGGYGEPRHRAETVEGTSTLFVMAGAKAMHVCTIGLYKQGNSQLRYQRTALDARFADSRRMLDNLKSYQRTLQSILEDPGRGYAALGIKPVQHFRGKFVGSETCGDCHSQAYEKWLETPHSHATQSISEPNQRSEIVRHFDPECLSCHVTGWNAQGYFPYQTGYTELKASSHLHGNGCENCHGPGQAHVSAESGDGDFTDEQIQKLRLGMRLELSKAEDKCLECHDIDNDPNFHADDQAFERYWELIKHPWRD